WRRTYWGQHCDPPGPGSADRDDRVTKTAPTRPPSRGSRSATTRPPWSDMTLDTAVPAVVVNMSDHGGLGIVRSLGRMGVAVHAVHDRKTPACASRYVTGFHLFDGDMGADRLVPFLLALAGR